MQRGSGRADQSGWTSEEGAIMRRPLILLAVVGVLVAAGCGSSDDEPGEASGGAQQVKVGIIPILDVAPIYLGKEKGFFTSRNIELTLESGQGGAAIVPGVVSGQFQFGFSNVTSLLIAQSRGLPLKVVSNGWPPPARTRPTSAAWSPGTPRSRRPPTWPASGSRSTPSRTSATPPSGPRSARPAATPRRSSSWSWPSPTCRPPSRRAGWTPSGWWSRSCRPRCPGRTPGRLLLRRHRARPHRGRLPHLRAAHQERPRPGQAVHRGHDRVAGLRRRPPRRGPPGADQLHPDRRGRHQGADPAQVAGRGQPGLGGDAGHPGRPGRPGHQATGSQRPAPVRGGRWQRWWLGVAGLGGFLVLLEVAPRVGLVPERYLPPD